MLACKNKTCIVSFCRIQKDQMFEQKCCHRDIIKDKYNIKKGRVNICIFTVLQ